MTPLNHRAALVAALLGFAACRAASRTDAPVPGPRLFARDPPLFWTALAGRELAPPTALGTSRFLAGWIPLRGGRDDGTPRGYRMTTEASVEWVGGAPPGAELLFGLDEESPRGGTLALSIDGGPELALPVADPVRVPLDAAAGGDGRGSRVLEIRLRVTSGEPPMVKGAVARGPAAPTEVAFLESWVESANVVELEGGIALRDGADFALTADRLDERGGVVGSALWKPSWLERRTGRARARLRVEAGDPSTRFVRVRMSGEWASTASEAPASEERERLLHELWNDLRVVAPVAAPAPAPAASSPPATAKAPATRPRAVVVYVMDALRRDALDADREAGGPAREIATPTWSRLAHEGVLARHHRAVAPNTMPSTKALFLGRPFAFYGGSKLRADDGETLAEAFRAGGYRTGLFSGNVHVSPAYGMERGFEVAPQETQFERHARPGQPNDNAARVERAALAWLDTLADGESAFLYLHTIHPHNPYAPPEPFASRFAALDSTSSIDGETKTLTDVKHGRRPADEADRERLRRLYRASLAYNDARLAGFVDELVRRFGSQGVWLALTSDHGEELFDHGGVLHGYTLHEELLRIPLVLWAPGRLEPRRIERTTDTLDLHRTLTALARGDAAPLDGAAAADEELHFAAASSLPGGIFSVQNTRWKVIWAPRTGVQWGQGDGLGRARDAEIWFDLAHDPGESRNRAGDAAPEPRWLRARLFDWIEDHRPREAQAGDAAPDEETLRALRALGYVN
jgi:arylsulfatase A-like enzyme